MHVFHHSQNTCKLQKLLDEERLFLAEIHRAAAFTPPAVLRKLTLGFLLLLALRPVSPHAFGLRFALRGSTSFAFLPCRRSRWCRGCGRALRRTTATFCRSL